MYNIFLFLSFILFSVNLSALNINETIESTVNSNPKVKIGLEKLNESKELIESSIGQKLPTITGTISGTYETSESKATTGTTTPEKFTDSYKLTISKNLYDAGFNDLEISRSEILFNDEIINFQINLQKLFLNAITGYFTVINYENSLKANKKNFESVSKALEEVKTKFELGSSTIYELQSSESSFAIASSNLFAAEKNYEISQQSFNRIVGKMPTNLEDIINIDQAINYNESLKIAFNNNLQLKLIKNQIENNKILLLKEQKTKKANLDLKGTAEYSDASRLEPGTETTKGSIALTLTIPIFQKNIDNSNIRKYQSKIIQSELNYNDYEADLEIEISNLFKDFNISKSEMISNLAIIKASETLIKILTEEYNIGTKTIKDLIDEESKLLTAKVNYLNSQKDYFVNYFKIKSLEGTLLNDFEKYLPEIN